MADVYETRLKENSNEEILPGYSADFPYVNSRAFLDNYHVPWHWHKAVELFYMESGELEYETPGGRTYFPQGSGGLINADVLHITRPCADAPTIQRLERRGDARADGRGAQGARRRPAIARGVRRGRVQNRPQAQQHTQLLLRVQPHGGGRAPRTLHALWR